MSIRLRLTLWYTAILSVFAAGFAGLVYVAVDRQLANELDHAVELRAVQVSQALATAQVGLVLGPIEPLHIPAPASLAEQSHYVQVIGAGGSVLASSSNLREPLPVPGSSVQVVLDGQVTRDVLTLASGERLGLYGAPLLLDERVVGAILVAAPLLPLEATLARLRLILTAAVVGAVFVAGGVGWLLAAASLSPVDQITRAAGRIGRSGDLSERLPEPRRRDELGRLARAFNDLLGRLDEAVSTQRRFLADASHELRTPLTTIRTNAESLLRTADADPVAFEDRPHPVAPPDAEALRSIARESARMGRLVTDLLVLARNDAGQAPARRPFMLDALLVEVYQQARRQAPELRVSIGDLEQVAVLGDPDQLKQVLLNLVDNACRYTPPGGRITLDLVQARDEARFSVRDTGVGIAPDDLPRIFERFYRADPAQTGRVVGSGLGLAISRVIAEAHGGRIEVESEVGVGSTFTMVLPVPASAAGDRRREPAGLLTAH